MRALDPVAVAVGSAPPFSSAAKVARVVVITGAGSGLGRALALALARSGNRLVLVGRREARLVETVQACVSLGTSPEQCLVLCRDIAAAGAVESIVAAVLQRFGAIDALVNNAGVARFGALADAQPDDWAGMLGTNLLAPALLIKCAAPSLRMTRGQVVNVGSIGGVLAVPGRALYGASKAALAHLTRSLARELAPDVCVNAILPGAIETEMYDDLGLDEHATQRLRAEMIRTTPLGRMGKVEDVVPWIEMLLSPAGSWVTGSLITIDGGRSC